MRFFGRKKPKYDLDYILALIGDSTDGDEQVSSQGSVKLKNTVNTGDNCNTHISNSNRGNNAATESNPTVKSSNPTTHVKVEGDRKIVNNNRVPTVKSSGTVVASNSVPTTTKVKAEGDYKYNKWTKIKFPYFEHSIDVSGKRHDYGKYTEMLKYWVFGTGYKTICDYNKRKQSWIDSYTEAINRGECSDAFIHNFNKSIDKECIIISFCRYLSKGVVVDWHLTFTLDDIKEMYDNIDKNGFYGGGSTNYHKRLSEPQTLRERVALKYNYTCCKCGNHIKDDFDLKIEYIIPIAQGGTTSESNMHVLCAKCRRLERKAMRNDADAIDYYALDVL